MEILTGTKRINAALAELKHAFRRTGTKFTHVQWSFPDGSSHKVPTWKGSADNKDFAVCFSTSKHMKSGHPLQVAIGTDADVFTPTVEINIPFAPTRRVNGCFACDTRGKLWLCHRGIGLTSNRPRKSIASTKKQSRNKKSQKRGGRIPKEVIHRHFRNWLQPSEDRGTTTKIIPITSLSSPDLLADLARFAAEVATLKEVWSATGGSAKKVLQRTKWWDKIRFPPSVSRAVDEHLVSYDYCHGPIQQALKEFLEGCLNPSHRVVLNSHIDLGIHSLKHLEAIFEVKTGLGSQLYSGIGQLFFYRAKFSPGRNIPLYLVLPVTAGTQKEFTFVGDMLKPLKVKLIIQQENGNFTMYGKKALRDELAPGWLK